MRFFDYSFLETGMLPAKFVSLAGGIYSLKTSAAVRKNDYENVFTELESVARIQSVKSSNAIEGIITSDQRIAEIVNQSSAPLNHNEAEIAGYRDALNIIHTNYQTLDFKESDILGLHNILFSFAEYEYAGQYKRTNNIIAEIDSNGKRTIRALPPK